MAKLCLVAVLAIAGLELSGGIILQGVEPTETPTAFSPTEMPAGLEPTAMPNVPQSFQAGPATVEPFNNLCIGGHSAPEFILIGAQRAATATFLHMMNSSQMVWARDSKQVHMHNQNKDSRLWLSHYPVCVESQRRIAVSDFAKGMVTESAAEAPHRLYKWYGKKMSKLIKFGIILREPLARIQSAFHWYSDMGRCGDYTSQPFKNYVSTFITNATRDPAEDPCEFVKNTNYTADLKAYFAVFSQSQFTVIPYQDVVKPRRDTSARLVFSVWESLGLNVTGATAPPVVQLNGNSHPVLAQDLMKTTRVAAQELIGKSIRVDSLAALLTRGARLPSYDGNTKSAAAISEWLQARW